jgi:hypothetical protein
LSKAIAPARDCVKISWKSKTPILRSAAAAIEADSKIKIKNTALHTPVFILMNSPFQSNGYNDPLYSRH